MDFFEQFNRLSSDTILNRLHLKTAADGKSYVCPSCEHGKNGDGIRPRTNDKGQTRWKCHGTCGTNFSNYDLAAAVLGMDTERDKTELVRDLKELFGLDDDRHFLSSKETQSARVDEKKSASEKTEPRNFAGLYKHCREHYSLRKFVDSQGGTWRGLTYETLNHAGALIHEHYKCGGDDECPAVILPYDDELYFWRSTVDKRRGLPKGAKRKLYIAAPISLEFPNFVSEGEIDALSIAQAINFENELYGSVATGGVGNSEMMIRELSKQFGNTNQKPSFIICLDNDKGGDENAQKFVSKLRAAGYPAVVSFLAGEKAGKYEVTQSGGETKIVEVPKIDANDLLRSEKLVGRLIDIVDETDKELRTQAATLRTNSFKTKTSAQIESPLPSRKEDVFGRSFADYFTEKIFRDVERTAKYAERKTGFENLDEKLTLIPGLYLLGGLPATGKTTFAWQLAEQLADNGELCIYCSYEMSELELFAKSVSRHIFIQKPALSRQLDLTSFNIRRGHVLHCDEVRAAINRFSSSKKRLRVAELSNMPVTKLLEKLKPIVANSDKSPVVVLDYLQILPATETDGRRESIDDTLRRLKDFQRSTESTFLVISSFNRTNYWSPVSFESFKESGGIEYSADAVLGLEICVNIEESPDTSEYKAKRKKAISEAYKTNERELRLACLKNRNGGAFDVRFTYHCKFDCFEEEIGEPIGDDEVPPERANVVDES